ncbi:TPA: SGNH/GDSL hydrolase family protein, partial [Klebsiella pneumoniae]
MKDLNDNALAFDDFMNSESDTFIDRFGDPKDSLPGTTKKIMLAADDVIEATRQNLIPLSRQYMTLAAAQADIANIPLGSTTYYRSTDDSALAIEIINNGGTLEHTGREMPSQYALREPIKEAAHASQSPASAG